MILGNHKNCQLGMMTQVSETELLLFNVLLHQYYHIFIDSDDNLDAFAPALRTCQCTEMENLRSMQLKMV